MHFMHFIPLFCVLLSTNACTINYNFKHVLTGKRHIAMLVLARGGSKSIPLKNIAQIGKTNLLQLTLDKIQTVSNRIVSIWVSTDSWPIYTILQRHHPYVNVHWRAPETATDAASSILAVNEFLQHHREVDVVGLVQCTSPFLHQTYLDRALALVHNGAECVFSVTRSYKLRWGEINNRLVPLNFDVAHRPRRQDWNGELLENGMFYFAIRSLLQTGRFQSDACKYVEVDEQDSLEIDDWSHLTLANCLYRNKLKI